MKTNKGIAPILIILIVVGVLAVGGVYYFWFKNTQKPVACTQEAKICPDGSAVGRTGPRCEFAACPEVNTAEQACINSGGKVSTSMCCKSANDFPSSCLIGACGCSPDNSHQIKVCDCGVDKCFDGEKCSSVETSSQIPSIDSVSPSFGSIGTVVELRGKNFSGFEGDLDAWIENAEGIKGIIYGEDGSNGNLIRFTLKSSFCQIDTSYSGLPCSGFLNIIPGTYKIYVEPWGQKSNEVTFTVKLPQ